MAVFNAAFPVLPGKVEQARVFAKETLGPRRSGFDESQNRGGITRETWSLQEMPDGSALVLVWFESPDPDESFAELAQDTSEFAEWFRRTVMEVTGVDLTAAQEAGPELILDWRS